MVLGIFSKKVCVGGAAILVLAWGCAQRPNPAQFGDHAAELPARVIEVSDENPSGQDAATPGQFSEVMQKPLALKMQRVGSRDQLMWVRQPLGKSKQARQQGEVVQLTDWPFLIKGAQVSQDGKWVAFFTDYYPGGLAGLWSLVVFSTDEAFPLRGYDLVKRVVSSGVVFDVENQEPQAVFGRDGRLIFYVKGAVEAKNPGADAIFATDLTTRKSYLLPTEKSAHRHLAVLASGQISFTAEAGRGGQRKAYLAQMELLEFPQTEITQNQHND